MAGIIGRIDGFIAVIGSRILNRFNAVFLFVVLLNFSFWEIKWHLPLL
ncbi:hypothetical protein BphiR1888_00059 [Acinetobacter phage Bphi-R1888]|nr:hypothetical protein BphiR1888_00059 [Acinetobacter phage Bphi-R1888]